jgi:hypothetical protein
MLMEFLAEADRSLGLDGLVAELRQGSDVFQRARRVFSKLPRAGALIILRGATKRNTILPPGLLDSLDGIVLRRRSPPYGVWCGLVRECVASMVTNTMGVATTEEKVFRRLGDILPGLVDSCIAWRNLDAHQEDVPQEQLTIIPRRFSEAVANLLLETERMERALSGRGESDALRAAIVWAVDAARNHSHTREALLSVMGQDHRNPFKRLASLDETERRIFGEATPRSQLSSWGQWAVRPNALKRARVLAGMSGCGKSSFLRAGLLPQVRARARESGMYVEPILLEPVPGFSRELDKALSAPVEGQILVLLDQFERVLQLAREEQESVGKTLHSALLERTDAKVVFSVREDATQLTVQWLKEAGITKSEVSRHVFEMLEREHLVSGVRALWRRSGTTISKEVVEALLHDKSEPRPELCMATTALGVRDIFDPAAVQMLFHRYFDHSPGEHRHPPPEGEIKRMTEGLPEYHLRDVVEHGELLSDDQRGLAQRILVCLVDARGSKHLVQSVTGEDIAAQLGANGEDVDEILRTLDEARLVRSQGAETFVLVHDRLAEPVFRLYGEAVKDALRRVAGCVDSVETLARTIRSEGELWKLEQFAADFFGDLARQLAGEGGQGVLLASFSESERREFARSLVTLLSKTARGLFGQRGVPFPMATAAAVFDNTFLIASMARLPRGVPDLVKQIKKRLFGSRTGDGEGTIPDVLERWLSMTVEVTGHGVFARSMPGRSAPGPWHSQAWLTQRHCQARERAGRRARRLVQAVLREAQSGGDIPFSRLLKTSWEGWRDEDLRYAYGAVPPTRFPLWRALLLLGQRFSHSGNTFVEAVVSSRKPGSVGYLFSFDWRIVPSTSLTEFFDVREDGRTYRGLLVHIPAGEHAMRNQRAARGLMIRTAAVETRSRKSSPGFHEADAKELIDGYGSETSDALSRVVENHAQLLRGAEQTAWILLEAQEYPQRELLEWVRRTQADIKSRYGGIEGRILADAGAGVANRKDLTRALASLGGIRQPQYRVIGPEAGDVDWDSLWHRGIGEGERFRRVRSRGEWETELELALSDFGSNGIVAKPLVTEFLKGATVLDSGWSKDGASDDFRHPWTRVRKISRGEEGLPPFALLEERIDVAVEVLSMVVERPEDGTGGSFVEVPPVFYRCTEIDVEDAADVPLAFECSWIFRDGLSERALGPVRASGLLPDLPSTSELHGALEKIKTDGEALALRLWEEVGSVDGLGAPNRFLACEWLISTDGAVYLNEIKPTQLDKGIISHFALSHGDSELLVRNLFGLPLPLRVQPTFADPVAFLATVLTRKIPSVSGRGRPLLTGYEPMGVEGALSRATAVHLYPDKMRSVPYAGRRFGVVYFTASNLAEAIGKWRGTQAESGLVSCFVPNWARQSTK